ncbi:DUF262 domain-containing protein [Pseudomonas sp.]|uniref:DUF262 domain-containing protein n=1 Tax=Pseudomonas sp. TaxID=306 RepID=UPI0028A1280F|nr:DUF262 domain-containing protein [Pseudomonas sp.]
MGFSSANLLTVQQACNLYTFEVPEFQRGYAWGQEQWQALWDDAVNLSRMDRAAQHYCGTIIVSPQSGSNGKVDLVDGQQRMTSIALMLDALDTDGPCITFRHNEPLQTYFNFYALRQTHLSTSLKQHTSYYARNIAAAHGFFVEQAEELSVDERLDLAMVLLERFKLFVLQIQPDFDVHVAFETINNRGKPLSTLEKLKNRLIYLASNAPAKKAGDAAIAEVHRCWKQVYYSLGAGTHLLDDDEFLRAHAMGWFRHERRAEWLTAQLFESEFSIHGECTPKDIIAYVRNLEVAAACWLLLHEPERLAPSVVQPLLALQKTANASAKPLLLWALVGLALAHDGLLQNPNIEATWWRPFVDLVKQVERFSILVVMANNRSSSIGQSDLNRCAYALANPGQPMYPDRPDLLAGAAGTVAVTFAHDYLKSIIYNRNIGLYAEDDDEDQFYFDPRFAWPGHFDPTRVQTTIADRLRKQKGFYSWPLGKFILYAWEDFLCGDRGRPQKRMPWEKFAWDESVEHIYPQTPVKLWHSAIALDGRTAQATRNAITHSLGNLVLLSRPRNASVSNAAYPSTKNAQGKRDHYKSGCYSEIQVAQHCEQWTVLQIAARGIAMMQHAQKTWDFEVVGADERLVAWLPLLFGDLAERVRKGDFTERPVDNRALAPWVAKFSRGLQ